MLPHLKILTGFICSSELAKCFPLAEVWWDDALLQQEEEVPLRGAVLLCLQRPHEPARAHLTVPEGGI